ncbi:hypothetical protein HXX01_03225, partial [Candidatus Nomurabacteria bacterium]|nr:hypothetical protein [Candidatus Nomurabacteria bacterium]
SNLYGQYSGLFLAQEYSKEISLYKAKAFIVDEIIGKSTSPIKFEVDPLCAAFSGHLTTLIFQCKEKNMEGLILGFYGDRVTSAGLIYKEYGFKYLPKTEASALLNEIKNGISQYEKFLKEDSDNNNIYFQSEDVSFILYNEAYTATIRVLWSGFDAEWSQTEFEKTMNKFNKGLAK